MGIEKFKVSGIIDDSAHEITGLFIVEITDVHSLKLIICAGSQISHQMPGRFVCQIIA